MDGPKGIKNMPQKKKERREMGERYKCFQQLLERLKGNDDRKIPRMKTRRPPATREVLIVSP